MLEEEILDDILVEKTAGQYKGAIAWWESRRWKYNKIVGGTGIVVYILMMLVATDLISAEGFGVFVGFGLLFLFIYNVIYTFLWGLELAIVYFFKKELSESVRNIFYWVGTALSIMPFLLLLLLAKEIGNNVF